MSTYMYAAWYFNYIDMNMSYCLCVYHKRNLLKDMCLIVSVTAHGGMASHRYSHTEGHM